jgi:hypothetical protein
VIVLTFAVDNGLILEAEADGGKGGGRRWMSVASLERVLVREDDD